MTDWISVRRPDDGRTWTSRAPFDPATTDALVRAARTVHRAAPPSKRSTRSVYVILLEFDRNDYGLYVGSTGRTPDERYLNHKRGHKASKWARKYGVGLLPALYRHLNPMDYEEAIRIEVALAEALATTGIRVRQG